MSLDNLRDPKNSNSVENEPIERARVWLERQIASHKLWERNEEAVLVIRHWNRYRRWVRQWWGPVDASSSIIMNVRLRNRVIWSEAIFVDNKYYDLDTLEKEQKIWKHHKVFFETMLSWWIIQFYNQCLPVLSLRWYSLIISSFLSLRIEQTFIVSVEFLIVISHVHRCWSFDINQCRARSYVNDDWLRQSKGSSH